MRENGGEKYGDDRGKQRRGKLMNREHWDEADGLRDRIDRPINATFTINPLHTIFISCVHNNFVSG